MDRIRERPHGIAQFVRQRGHEGVLAPVGVRERGRAVARRFQLLLQVGAVAHDLAVADEGAVRIAQRHENPGCPEARAVGPLHPAIVLGLVVGVRDLAFVFLEAAGALLRREEHVEGPPHDIRGGIPEHLGGPGVPPNDRRARIREDEGVFPRLLGKQPEVTRYLGFVHGSRDDANPRQKVRPWIPTGPFGPGASQVPDSWRRHPATSCFGNL